MLSDGGGVHVDAVDDDHADAAALMNMNTNDDHARRFDYGIASVAGRLQVCI